MTDTAFAGSVFRLWTLSGVASAICLLIGFKRTFQIDGRLLFVISLFPVVALTLSLAIMLAQAEARYVTHIAISKLVVLFVLLCPSGASALVAMVLYPLIAHAGIMKWPGFVLAFSILVAHSAFAYLFLAATFPS